MKRTSVELFDSPTRKQTKITHHEQTPSNDDERTCLFSNDVLGIICSFLPFQYVQSNVQLINHQWNQSCVNSDIRFKLIHTIEKYLSQEFSNNSNSENDDEENTRLLVSIKQMLNAHEKVIGMGIYQNRKSELDAWFRKMLTRSDEFPNYRIIKYERLFFDKEEIAVLMINLDQENSFKLTCFYSSDEDIVAYVDVIRSNSNSSTPYDWKGKWNIDPNVKRNTVLLVNAEDFEYPDLGVEDFSINMPFFDALNRELGIPKRTRVKPFNAITFLWRGVDDSRRKGNDSPIKDVEFETDLEIHDERVDSLIPQLDLTLVREEKVLQIAWKVACRAFTVNRERNLVPNTESILVSNVIGNIVTINLNRNPRRCADVTFDLLYNGTLLKAKFEVSHQFYYGHDDSYKSEALFRVNNNDTQFNYLQWQVQAQSNILEWSYTGEKMSLDESGDSEFTRAKPTLLTIFRQLLSIVPHYQVLDDTVVSDEQDLLEYFVEHDNQPEEEGKEEDEEEDEDKGDDI